MFYNQRNVFLCTIEMQNLVALFSSSAETDTIIKLIYIKRAYSDTVVLYIYNTSVLCVLKGDYKVGNDYVILVL